MFAKKVAYSIAVAGLAIVAAYTPAQELSNQFLTLSQTHSQGPRMSVHFQGVHVKEILDWLHKSGVNFMIADSDIKDKTVTLSVNNEPVDDILEALGTALDGHWVHNGNIRVFKPGRGPFVTDFATFPKLDGKTPKAFNFNLPNDKTWFSKQFNFSTPDGKSFSPKNQFKFVVPDGKSFGFFGNRIRIDSDSFHKLMKSLTDQQKELNKKQGYLKFDDLTPDQRAILNVHGSPGGVEIKFSSDGESITIKSK